MRGPHGQALGRDHRDPDHLELQGRPHGARVLQLDPRGPEGSGPTPALKTANSGYLTRRLVDVAQDCIVRSDNCGTENAITTSAAVNDGEIVASISERVLGRVAAGRRDGAGEPTRSIVAKDELIDERKADAIEAATVQTVRIRSPLTCEAEEGVCAMCYGRDSRARAPWSTLGQAVGNITSRRAVPIGEPGTQHPPMADCFHIRAGVAAQGGQQFVPQRGEP